jgi:hypothetical protein
MGVNENDVTVSVPKLFFGTRPERISCFPLRGRGHRHCFQNARRPEKLFEVIARYRPHDSHHSADDD